jgi:hypothetical protein
VRASAASAVAIVIPRVVASFILLSREVVASIVVRRGAVHGGTEIASRTGRARTVLRDVEPQRTSGDLASMELLNRLLGMFFGCKPHEREAPGAARLAVFWNVNIHYLADFTEELT